MKCKKRERETLSDGVLALCGLNDYIVLESLPHKTFIWIRPSVYLKQLCVAHSCDILCDLLSLHICRWKERLIDRGFRVSCNKWKFHLPLPLLFVSTAGLSQDKTISFPQAFLQLHVHHQTQLGLHHKCIFHPFPPIWWLIMHDDAQLPASEFSLYANL